MKMFTDLYKCTTKANQAIPIYRLEHAVVIDNRIIVTDGQVMVVIPIKKFDEIQQIENLNGKAIHRDILTKMSKSIWKKIICTPNEIHLLHENENKNEYYPYSAELFTGTYKEFESRIGNNQSCYSTEDKNGSYQYDMEDEYNDFKGTIWLKPENQYGFKYPNYEVVIPKFDKKTNHSAVGIDPNNLKNVSDCLPHNLDKNLSSTIQMTFGYFGNIKLYDFPTMGIKVDNISDVDSFGIVMPVMLFNEK